MRVFGAPRPDDLDSSGVHPDGEVKAIHAVALLNLVYEITGVGADRTRPIDIAIHVCPKASRRHGECVFSNGIGDAISYSFNRRRESQ